MIKAVKKDTGNVVFMRLKKHNCPVCQNQLKVVRMSKVVKSKTRESGNFKFDVCDVSLGDKVKFVWYEFKCRECDKRFSEAEIRAAEKARKKEAKKAARLAKKAEKLEK